MTALLDARHRQLPLAARAGRCRSRRSPVVTGPNGSGKSSVYRAAAAGGHRTGARDPSLAREGGLPSTLWAGPERFSRAMLAGDTPVTGTVRNRPVSLKLGCVRRLRLCDRSGPAGAGQLAIHARSRREARMYLERRAAAAVDAAGRTTGRQIRTRTASGDWRTVPQPVASFDSMMTEFADPVGAPEMIAVRERIRSWRFYDHFRTDAGRRRGGRTSARTRRCSRTTVPISRRRCRRSARSAMPLDATIDDAFPGASIDIDNPGGRGRFDVLMRQPGLLRPLAAELSDGTLRYLLLAAALLTPRPPALMVLNEPETSLHPDLLPALGRLIAQARGVRGAGRVARGAADRDALEREAGCESLVLDKQLGATALVDADARDLPPWKWPAR
jgi:predicted ATPase